MSEKESNQLSKSSILALNYDLLLQYPVHRLPGNAKIRRPLHVATDAALIAEETLTNEALDLIEALYDAEQKRLDDASTRQKDARLKRLLPLLLYRYRPLTSAMMGEKETTAPEEPVVGRTDAGAMVIERERETMQILAFNFRPYNTGLCYNNWPLGRTKEIVVTAETVEEHDSTPELFTGDSNVYYIAEPTDKLEWLNSKHSAASQEFFNVDKFYHNADAFFAKYAPRARAIRKARFRSTLPESRMFRAFLFESRFSGDEKTKVGAQWDSIWRDSFDSLRYTISGPLDEADRRRRWHLLANLLALLQPSSVAQFSDQVTSLNHLLRFATRAWTGRQVELLEQLLRATVYEKGVDPALAERKNCILISIVGFLGSECSTLNIGAATLVLYTALRSKFDVFLCSKNGGEDRQDASNALYRIVASLQQSLDTVDAVHDAALSANQLWGLAEMLLRYMREANASIESLDFVSMFVKHIGATIASALFSADAMSFQEGSVSNALEQNFTK